MAAIDAQLEEIEKANNQDDYSFPDNEDITLLPNMQPNIQSITSAGHPNEQGGVYVQPQIVHNLNRGLENSAINPTVLTSTANFNSTSTLQNNGNASNFDQDRFLS